MKQPKVGSTRKEYRIWTPKLGLGTLSFDEPPVLAAPFDGTQIVEVEVTIKAFADPVVDTSIYCYAA